MLHQILAPQFPNAKQQVRNHGVIFDRELESDKQINAVVKVGGLQLCAVSRLKQFHEPLINILVPDWTTVMLYIFLYPSPP